MTVGLAEDTAFRTKRQAQRVWWLSYAVVVAGGLMIGFYVRNRTVQPYLGLSIGLILLLGTVWILRPRIALYATLFMTTVSDFIAANWFPFAKPLSNRESIAYVSDSATISPLEISLLMGFLSAGLQYYARTGRVLPDSRLTRPMLVFVGFVLLGFAHGILRGGPPVIAVFESRGLFYTFATFTIVATICDRPHHLRNALVAVLMGIVGHAFLSLNFLSSLTEEARSELERLGEHGASLTMNILFLTLISSLLFRGFGRRGNTALALAAMPVLVVYLVSQRRAAVAGLAIAVLALMVIIFWKRRRAFWVALPVLAIATTGYTGAFWNSSSTAGFPAQAVKSIVAPGQAAEEDQGSNQYRAAENYNVIATIRAAPIRGLGFGHEFYRPIPLPEISDFALARYQPHNSFLWIWIKLGFFGFVTMIYVFGRAIMLGAERVRAIAQGPDLIVAIIGVLYPMMFLAFTYVDISWDPRLTPILGLCLAICGSPAFADNEQVDRTHENQREDDDLARAPIRPMSR